MIEIENEPTVQIDMDANVPDELWLEIMKRVITQVTLKHEDWKNLCQSLPTEFRAILELRSREKI